MNIPVSMREELGSWNGGAGIDLEAWTNCTGNYALAVGYLTVFWPEFVEHDGYILRAGFSMEALRSFRGRTGATRQSVERVMNHLHIADIHGSGGDFTEDKVVVLARALKEIHQAKLASEFPDAHCIVELSEARSDAPVLDYQITFWQGDAQPAVDDLQAGSARPSMP